MVDQLHNNLDKLMEDNKQKSFDLMNDKLSQLTQSMEKVS